MKTVKTPVIMISTLTEAGAETTIKALELGAVDFVPKAFGDHERNIFRGAEELHEKLIAAAGAEQDPAPTPSIFTSGLPRVVQEPAPLPPKAVFGLRVSARLVVIGSSTGGPKALQTVIEQLPANLPVPVVVAQHMPPQFTLALARRLDETCKIKVRELVNNDPLMPGTVYISPGGMHTRVTQTGLRVSEDRGESLYKPSVDVLAESAAQAYGKSVVAVMLTGMGSDGMKQFVNLKNIGAHVIAQDKESCVVYGMPKAIVEAGAATEVLPLEDIGRRIAALLG
jgi:two-component system chemotaxis response regulator CheB